jgi:hypothetical protein
MGSLRKVRSVDGVGAGLAAALESAGVEALPLAEAVEVFEEQPKSVRAIRIAASLPL